MVLDLFYLLSAQRLKLFLFWLRFETQPQSSQTFGLSPWKRGQPNPRKPREAGKKMEIFGFKPEKPSGWLKTRRGGPLGK